MPDPPAQRRHTDDHGAPGLRRKFDCFKPSAGRVSMTHPGCHVYADSDRLGADGEFVFVLRPETDKAACAALRTYAAAVSGRDTKLAGQLRAELARIAADNR